MHATRSTMLTSTPARCPCCDEWIRVGDEVTRDDDGNWVCELCRDFLEDE